MIRRLSILSALLLTILSTAQAQDWLKAGPYLQELSEDGVTVVFENNIKPFSWVELKKKGTTVVTKYYDDRDGQHQIYSEVVAPRVAAPLQNFTIRVDGLASDTEYEYRVCTQLVNWVKPYSASVGDIYEGDWHTFRTLNPNATEHHLVVVSDMHCRPDTLESMLNTLGYQTADHIIYAGDMMDNMQITANKVKDPEEPYASFINKSVELFAQTQDFCMVRGDHETKGDISRFFRKYFPHQSDKLYNAYRWGDLMVVLLDGGEAEADGDPTARVTNLGAFNQYREEEALWFSELMQTDEFRSAKYRIVVSHMPVPNDREDAEDAGTTHFAKVMLPLLNQANIDLLVCGHRHPESYTMIAKGKRGNEFPVLIQGYNFGARLDIADGKITVTTAGGAAKTKVKKLKAGK